MAKETEWHRHQRLESVTQRLHERAHGHEWGLIKARGPARQLHRTEIDLGRHESPQRSVERSISACMRKGEKTAANSGAFIAKGDPPVERHRVHLLSRRLTAKRAGPRDQAQGWPRLEGDAVRHAVAAIGGARYSFS